MYFKFPGPIASKINGCFLPFPFKKAALIADIFYDTFFMLSQSVFKNPHVFNLNPTCTQFLWLELWKHNQELLDYFLVVVNVFTSPQQPLVQCPSNSWLPGEVMRTQRLNRGSPGEGSQTVSRHCQHSAAYLPCDIGQAAWWFWASVSVVQQSTVSPYLTFSTDLALNFIIS